MAERLQSTRGHAVALGTVVVVAAVAAVALHRNGHTQGDDFALYLRQARSLFDGDVGQVVADNRFSVVNSGPGFSPIAYPWGWPLLLSPFVQLWGLDYDRLKLVVVASMCVWLVLLHGVIRRRIGRPLAFGIVAIVATAPVFLRHTDQLISEFPFLASIGLFLWWYDRIRASQPLISASSPDLIVLGALATMAFNIRREGLVLVVVIVGMQIVELLTRDEIDSGSRLRLATGRVRRSWRTIVTPIATFVVATSLFQLLLPTALFPDNGNAATYIPDRFGDYPGVLTSQLGLGDRPILGLAIITVAIIGAVVGVRRRPAFDGPLVLLTVFSALLISTHFRLVPRYWFQVTPWVIYFAIVAISAAASIVIRDRQRLATALVAAPLVAVLIAHAVVLPGDIGDARQFDADGRVQWGPAHPDVIPVFDAVERYTPPDSVVAFYRARTMTLLTDRRSIQSTKLETVRRGADYYAQRKSRDYSQTPLSVSEAEDLGFEMIWEDDTWILWKLP